MSATLDPSDMANATDDVLSPANSSDLLSRIRSMMPSMSGNQKRVAQLLFDEPRWFVSANVEDIATRAGVSAPTVIRFARKVGFGGLRDFKLSLAGALALGAPLLHRAVHEGDSARDVLANVTGSMTTVLADWQRRIDPTVLEQAATAIFGAKRIQCFGTGALSHFLAQDLQARLFRLGHDAHTFSDAHYQLVAAAGLDSADVVIAISFVGQMQTLLRAVDMAKSRGATIIALTQARTALATRSDIVLPMDVPSDTTMLVGTDAYVVQLITIEVLMILAGLKQGSQLKARMQDIQKVLRTHSVDNEDPSVLHAGWRKMLGDD